MIQTYPYQPSPFKGQTYALQQLASYLKRQAPTVNQFHWDVTFTKPFPVHKAARNVGAGLGTLEKGQLVYQTWEAQPVWLYIEEGWIPAPDPQIAGMRWALKKARDYDREHGAMISMWGGGSRVTAPLPDVTEYQEPVS